MKIRSRIYLSISFTLLTACNLAPLYERPAVPLAERFSEKHISGDAIANIPWWNVFSDQQLHSLIKEALENNKDITLALARIEESKALVGFTRADQFPFINIKSGASRGDLGLEFPAATSLGLLGDLTFEVDLWSKLKNATDAQRALLLSSAYGLQTVTISLISQVADLYFTLVDLDSRIAISEETIKNRKNAKNIISERFQKGIVSELELNQAQIEEVTVAVNLITLQRELRLTEHALLVLLGKTSGKIDRKVSLEKTEIGVSLPAGLPADLLQRRPDLMTLEQNLRSQLYLEGVTEAQRLPSLQILGTLGLATSSSSDLFRSDTQSWSIGGNLFSPLLNLNKNISRVEAQQARVEQAKRIYEDGVIKAVREVEDSLVEIETFEKEYQQRVLQVRYSKNANQLTRARYDNGIAAYIEVLDIERSRYTAELSASLTLRRYLSSVVKLYRALGGGWDQNNVARSQANP